MIRTIKNWWFYPVCFEEETVREVEDFLASMIGRRKAGKIIDKQVSYLFK